MSKKPQTATPSGEEQVLALEDITIDPEIQPREAVSNETVDEYAEAYRNREPLPPLEAVTDGVTKWLWDGGHRTLGAIKAGVTHLSYRLTKGDKDKARWLAAGANRKHGLKRSPEDKRRAVGMALALRPDLSDNAIADHCGVHHDLVARVRSLAETDSGKAGNKTPPLAETDSEPTVRTDKNGRRMNTANIGKGRKKAEPAAPAKAETNGHAKTPAKPEQPPTPEPITDDEGLDVPESLLPSWQIHALFDEAASLFRQLIKLVDQIARSPGGEALHVRRCQLTERGGKQTFRLDKLQHLVHEVGAERPSVAACPHCHHAHPKRIAPGCKACLGTGWVTKETWDRSPEDYRALVVAARKEAAKCG